MALGISPDQHSPRADHASVGACILPLYFGGACEIERMPRGAPLAPRLRFPYPGETQLQVFLSTLLSSVDRNKLVAKDGNL